MDILSLNVFRVVNVPTGGTLSTIADCTGYDFVGFQKDATALGTTATLVGTFDATVTPVPVIDSAGTAVGFTFAAATAQLCVLQQVKEVRALSRIGLVFGLAQPVVVGGTNFIVGLRYIT